MEDAALKDKMLQIAKPILFNTEMVKAILEGRKTVTRRLVKSKSKKACGFFVTFRKLDNAFMGVYDYDENEMMFESPQTQPAYIGDILYVRETWFLEEYYDDEALIRFKAGGKQGLDYETEGELYHKLNKFAHDKWNPSLFMPKEAARIFLKVKDVRVERLQDITEEQAKAEGICRLYDDMSKDEYETWARRIGKLDSQEECSFKNYLWHGNFGLYGSGNNLSDAWEYQYSGYDNAVGSFSSLWNTTVDLKDWEKYGWDANPWVWVIEFERIELDSEV